MSTNVTLKGIASCAKSQPRSGDIHQSPITLLEREIGSGDVLSRATTDGQI